jgi:hypothetical protein
MIISVGPSTLSMVPRIRTVGGCWAHAIDPKTDSAVSDASSEQSTNDGTFGMVFPQIFNVS